MKQFAVIVFLIGIVVGAYFLWDYIAKNTYVLIDQPELPLSVSETRKEIFYAASSRNYDVLTLLAGNDFSYTFGGPLLGMSAGDYWKKQKRTSQPLQVMQEILNQPYGYANGIYVWPGVFLKDANDWTEGDISVLESIATKDAIESYRAFGSYYGYRLGISRDGTWLYFLSGD